MSSKIIVDTIEKKTGDDVTLVGNLDVPTSYKITGTDADSIQAPGLITSAGGGVNSSLNTALNSATFPAGHIVQIKGKHDSTQDAFSVGTLPVKLPLNISITPTSTTNTIIIHGCYFCGSSNFNGGVGLMRHLSSVELNSTYMTANDDSIPRIGKTSATTSTTFIREGNFYNADDPLGTAYTMDFVPFTYYDSSYSTTSGSDLNSITYTLYGEASSTQTYYYNRVSNALDRGHATSFIYAYEIVGSIT